MTTRSGTSYGRAMTDSERDQLLWDMRHHLEIIQDQQNQLVTDVAQLRGRIESLELNSFHNGEGEAQEIEGPENLQPEERGNHQEDDVVGPELEPRQRNNREGEVNVNIPIRPRQPFQRPNHRANPYVEPRPYHARPAYVARDRGMFEYDRGHPRQGRRDFRDRDDDITPRVRIEAPSFDGRLDPKYFSDWLSDMDHFFDWHDMSEGRKVRFAKMKLTNQAKIHWVNVERQLERLGQEPIVYWEEMKEKLREKYLPASYRDHMLDQLHTLRQGNMSVLEYMNKFDEILVRCDINEDPRQTISKFKMGLRTDIQREMIAHTVSTLDHAF